MGKINSELVAQNLYKGWVDCNKSDLIKKSIEATGKKVLIIDDNFNDFQDVFYQVIGKDNIVEFFNNDYSLSKFKHEQEKENFTGCIHRLNKVIGDCCMIISDLYLIEQHGMEFFSTPENADTISGFVLNKEIKRINSMIPVMMFTTSNKVWNYKLFDSYGIDEWVVKFDDVVEGQSSSAITKSFFESFELAVLNILKNNPYLFLLDVYQNINNLPQKGLWWDSTNNNKRKEIITITNESLVALKSLLNKQSDYEQLLSDQKIIYGNSSYTCSAIISQLGNIVEIIYSLYEEYTNRNADYVEDGINLFLLKNRNLAAHKSDYRDFTIDDVILEIALINFSLSKSCLRVGFVTDFKRPKAFITAKECSLLWNIIQLYNMNYSLSVEMQQLLQKRVKKYLDTIFISRRTGVIDVSKLKWFRNFMKSEHTLKKFNHISAGNPGYKLSVTTGKLLVELSIPN